VEARDVRTGSSTREVEGYGVRATVGRKCEKVVAGCVGETGTRKPSRFAGRRSRCVGSPERSAKGPGVELVREADSQQIDLGAWIGAWETRPRTKARWQWKEDFFSAKTNSSCRFAVDVAVLGRLKRKADKLMFDGISG